MRILAVIALNHIVVICCRFSHTFSEVFPLLSKAGLCWAIALCYLHCGYRGCIVCVLGFLVLCEPALAHKFRMCANVCIFKLLFME